MATTGPWMQYIVRHRAKSSRYLICIILRQTHFLQVPPTRNITLHTLKGLNTEVFGLMHAVWLSILQHTFDSEALCWPYVYRAVPSAILPKMGQ